MTGWLFVIGENVYMFIRRDLAAVFARAIMKPQFKSVTTAKRYLVVLISTIPN